MSQPCCMKAPSENQRELKMPNSLGGWSVGPSSVVPSSGSSACHSYGLKRLTWKTQVAWRFLEVHKGMVDYFTGRKKLFPWICRQLTIIAVMPTWFDDVNFKNKIPHKRKLTEKPSRTMWCNLLFKNVSFRIFLEFNSFWIQICISLNTFHFYPVSQIIHFFSYP